MLAVSTGKSRLVVMVSRCPIDSGATAMRHKWVSVFMYILKYAESCNTAKPNI